jgi:tRNA(fMet)-specific endonuclease VapC
MRKFILDTNIILAYIRQNSQYFEADKKLNLSADDVQLIVSVVTIGEINVLATRNNWGAAKLELLNRFFQETLIVVDISVGAPELIAAYVEIDCFSKNKSMGKNNLWIAATAKVTNATLVTTDGDFDHLGISHLHLAKIEVV